MQKYINLNAQYGYDQDASYVYESVEEIMDNMDRLGIWQTTVEYVGDTNAMRRVKQLLTDIQKIPNWRERIIPAFVLDESVLFATGAMKELKRILKENQPCCIVFKPKTAGIPLRMADLLLDQLQEYCSVVLIDRKELNDTNANDLVYLAQRYSQMSFVVRQIMWGEYPLVVDMMSRAKNIYADSSRLHTNRALEMFNQYFGEDRVVFSTDLRCNGGAPMAAITFADISEEAKDKLRFGNFVNLFRKEEDRKKLIENSKVIPNRVKNSFWTPFVEQGITPDVEIYDVHTHLGDSGYNWFLPNADLDQQVVGFEQDMDMLNINKVVVTNFSLRGNIFTLIDKLQEKVGGNDRFRGYLMYNPNVADEYTEEKLDAYFAKGFYIGLKTLPSYMNVDIRDERYDAMFSYAHKHGLPILLHTWDGDGAQGNPRKCAEAAAKWPNAKVLMGHSGGGLQGRLECEEIAKDPKYSNVYFEYCGSFTANRCWEDTLKNIDYKRVLYGSDCCAHSMQWEMGKLLSSDIPDEQLTAILGGNAKKLFGF